MRVLIVRCERRARGCSCWTEKKCWLKPAAKPQRGLYHTIERTEGTLADRTMDRALRPASPSPRRALPRILLPGTTTRTAFRPPGTLRHHSCETKQFSSPPSFALDFPSFYYSTCFFYRLSFPLSDPRSFSRHLCISLYACASVFPVGEYTVVFQQQQARRYGELQRKLKQYRIYWRRNRMRGA